MTIINPQFSEDLRKGAAIHINLGSGGKRAAGVYGVDLLPMEGVDVQADLNEPLDLLPDNCVSSVVSFHTFEHVVNFFGLLKELHRVVRPDGRIEVVVPHFSNPQGYSDPTHVRFFGLFTMLYFTDEHRWKRKVPNFYTDIRFVIDDVYLKFADAGLDRFFGGAKEWMTNLNPRTQAFYERHLCWIAPAGEIVYTFHPKKG